MFYFYWRMLSLSQCFGFFFSCMLHDSLPLGQVRCSRPMAFKIYSFCFLCVPRKHTFCLFPSISSSWEQTEICPAYSNYDIILKKPGGHVTENVNLTFLWCSILIADVSRLASALPTRTQATYHHISSVHNAIRQISSCQ